MGSEFAFKFCSKCDFQMNLFNFQMNTQSQLKQKKIKMVNQETK